MSLLKDIRDAISRVNKAFVSDEKPENTVGRKEYHNARLFELDVVSKGGGYTVPVTADNGVTRYIRNIDDSCFVWPCRALKAGQMVRFCFVADKSIGYFKENKILSPIDGGKTLEAIGTVAIEELPETQDFMPSYVGGQQVMLKRIVRIFSSISPEGKPIELISPNFEAALVLESEKLFRCNGTIRVPIYGNKMNAFMEDTKTYYAAIQAWRKNAYDPTTNPDGQKLKLFYRHNGAGLRSHVLPGSPMAEFHVIVKS